MKGLPLGQHIIDYPLDVNCLRYYVSEGTRLRRWSVVGVRLEIIRRKILLAICRSPLSPANLLTT